MHLRSLPFLVLGSAALLVACSDSPGDSLSKPTRAAQSSSAKNGGPATSPAASPAQADTNGAPAPATTPPAATPSRPLRAGVCENPTCTVGQGTCGCTATQTDGATVTMDCQGGVCTCTTGDNVTTQVGDDNCANDGDARTLYSANCGCL